MLKSLIKQFNPSQMVVVFDAKGPTFRNDMYADYKAHRPPMPEELVRQIEPLNECVRALGWPLLAIEGVEADDVIGTLARAAAAAGVGTLISTGDKDLAQLVDGHVTLVNTMIGETLDPAGVERKFGVPPERILDYLTLVGDAVDNVPGVAKVGPKTAVKWLIQYGSLDAVVAHAAEIGGVVGENLRKALDWLPQARVLLTVKCDVPLPLALPDLTPQPEDRARLAELFERLDFRTWRRELDQPASEPATVPGSAPPPPDDVERHYQTIATEAELEHWIARLESIRCGRNWSGSRSRSNPGTRPISRSGIATPGHRTSSIATACSRGCGLGWKTHPARSSARTSSTTCTCSPTTACESRASSTTPCSNPTCWKATSRTTWTASPRATSASPPSATTT